MSGTLGNRCRMVTAHAHGEDRQSLIGCDLAEPPEMGGCRLVDRRNGHQPLDTETIIASRQSQQILDIRNEDACLLGFGPCIDLEQHRWRAPRLLDGLGECAGQFRTVERLDDIEQDDRIDGLVGLERTDQAEMQIWQRDPARAPAPLCLLHPVFAEHPLTCCQSRIDRNRLLGFRHRDQGHVCGIASGSTRRGFDAGSHHGESRGYGRIG